MATKMYLYPVTTGSNDDIRKLKHSGAIEASRADISEIFAKNYLRSQGFFSENNLTQMPEDEQQLPLLTYPFIDYLLTADLKERSLVELGSGNSTVLFSKLYGKVVSYETNEKWINETKAKVGDNTSIQLVTREALENAEFEINDIDCLLIDFAGKRTKFISNYLKNSNISARVIFLDNSDMYRLGVKLLREANYLEVPFYGLKSGQNWLSCTSMFIKNTEDSLISTKYISSDYTNNDIANKWDMVD